MTVLEVIQKSTEFLAKKGVESPRLQTELLLAHILKMPRMKLYLNFERVLLENETSQLREFVKRRGNREPLQHIVGTTSFCGLEIAVNKNVLIPRPETELLAERAWKFLNDFHSKNSQSPIALDFGTGSGCLAISLAVKSPTGEIHALDISESALNLARENAGKNAVADKIKLYLGDGFSALPEDLKFDLIVSNPPYISSSEIETLDPEVRDFDPKLALDGGEDGLNFYRMLAEKMAKFLKPNGCIMMEFGEGQAPAIREIFEAANWKIDFVEKDYTQRERFLGASPSK